jgi:hypothetical protein
MNPHYFRPSISVFNDNGIIILATTIEVTTCHIITEQTGACIEQLKGGRYCKDVVRHKLYAQGTIHYGLHSCTQTCLGLASLCATENRTCSTAQLGPSGCMNTLSLCVHKWQVILHWFFDLLSCTKYILWASSQAKLNTALYNLDLVEAQ